MFDSIVNHVLLFCFLISETAKLPRLDIAFVVSATAITADNNFKLIKSTIEYIVEEHGVKKHLYAMVVFGQNADIIFPLQKTSEDTLISLIKGAQQPTGSPDVVNALENTKQMFFKPSGGARPDSKKIIVVMIDRKTVNRAGEIDNLANEYEDGKVKFVTVVIGNEADPDELTPFSPDKDKDKIVKTDKDADPKGVGKRIWAMMALGKHQK